MSDETPVYKDGETVPVPDKGGWIDGETGAVYGGPPPAAPKAEPKVEPKEQPAKTPSVPKR